MCNTSDLYLYPIYLSLQLSSVIKAADGVKSWRTWKSSNKITVLVVQRNWIFFRNCQWALAASASAFRFEIVKKKNKEKFMCFLILWIVRISNSDQICVGKKENVTKMCSTQHYLLSLFILQLVSHKYNMIYIAIIIAVVVINRQMLFGPFIVCALFPYTIVLAYSQ